MKLFRLISFLGLFPFLSITSKAQLTSTNLPIVIVTTSGTIGTSTIQGTMSIINNVSGLNTPTSTPVFTGMIGIKLRGNAVTQSYPKKTYTIETWSAASVSMDTSLLGMPSENDWVLLASYPDRSLLRTNLSFYLNESMGRYAPRMKFCEVIINSQYQGIYSFGEKVKRDTSRVDIAKLTSTDNSGVNLTGGYIWKIDDEVGAGWNSVIAPPYGSTQQISFNFEYPDAGAITPAQAAYSKAYIDSFEAAMNSVDYTDTLLGWRNFAAEGSLIDFMIMQEVSKNYEAYRQNTFLYKDKSKKVRVGPLWNGELAWDNTSLCNGSKDTGWCFNFGGVCGTEAKLPPFWWSKLTTDSKFMDSLKCTYINYRKFGNALDTNVIFHFIDSVNTYLNAQSAVTRNFTLWPIWGVPVVTEPTPMATNYSGEIANLKAAIRKRLIWLDGKWTSTLCPSPSSVMNQNIENEITIFPNPTTDEISIQSRNNQNQISTIELLNVEGKKMLEVRSFSNNQKISLKQFASGVYFVQIKTANGISIRKVVKE